MKKLFLIVVLFLLSIQMNAQVNNNFEINNIDWSSAQSRSYIDTLFPTNISNPSANCNYIWIPTYQTGYVVGSNPKGDKQKLQKYGALQQTLGDTYMDEIIVYFRKKKVSANPGNIIAVIYDVNPSTHGPGNEIFFTDPINLANIDTTQGNMTVFTMPLPIQLMSDSFFVGFEMQLNNGDEIGGTCTIDDGIHGPCFSGLQMAWEQRSDNSYHAFNENSATDWGLDVDLWIFPVMELPGNGTGQSISMNGITLFPVTPNPGRGNFEVSFSLKEACTVKINLFAQSGKLIKVMDLGFLTPGIHNLELNKLEFESGVYFLQVITEGGTMTTKILIQK